MNPKHSFILALLITLVIANFIYLSNSLGAEREEVLVTRVIDGDTFESEDAVYRLVNINTPEKGEKGYLEAKSFLKILENKTVEIELIGLDKYSRTLVKVYSPKYVNLELIEKGMAKKFLVQEDELKIFAEAEESAVLTEKGIWEKSDYFNCFEAEIDEEKEEAMLKNSCNSLNLEGWVITDESRKKYKFKSVVLEEVNLHSGEGKDDENNLFWGSSQNIWNNDRDTLYLFDDEGRIAHYNSYGY